MSNTFDIVCAECGKKLWFGQASKRPGVGLRIYDYVDEHGAQHLARFLAEHFGHPLVVEDENNYSVDASYVDYPEHEPPQPV